MWYPYLRHCANNKLKKGSLKFQKSVRRTPWRRTVSFIRIIKYRYSVVRYRRIGWHCRLRRRTCRCTRRRFHITPDTRSINIICLKERNRRLCNSIMRLNRQSLLSTFTHRRRAHIICSPFNNPCRSMYVSFLKFRKKTLKKYET